MSGDRPAPRQALTSTPTCPLECNVSADQVPCPSSFGDPNAQPPTPEQQTSPAATFSSPVFATPKQNQGSFPESGSWTPRFAEDYSVFNSTPGNLRGTLGPFDDFTPFTPSGQTTGHRRLESSDSVSANFAPHANPFSPNPNFKSPPVEPAYQLPSTSYPLNATPKGHQSSRIGSLPSPNPSLQASAKHGHQRSSQGVAQAQTATPPPSSRKGRRKTAPKLKMQNDGQDFGQPDFAGASQPQELSGLLASPGDLFSYPMSAPVTGPDNFWDPSTMAMAMDMDFGAADMFQPDATSGHRHTGSFDWNSEVQMFQDPPQPAPVSAKPTNAQPPPPPLPRKERTLAPKPPVSDQTPAAPLDNSMALPGDVDNAFGIMGSGAGVDPGILFSRPQSAAGDLSFNAINDAGSAEAALAESTRGPAAKGVRRSASVRDARNGKMPERAFASSPVKPSAAPPGLARSQSENRGRRSIGRGAVASQPSSSRPAPLVRNGAGTDAGRATARANGRLSPLKKQHRLSGLASIPESASRPGSRASVKFYIGADGRAHAEAAQPADGPQPSPTGPRSRSSVDASQYDDDSDTSTDDEPIIIPSRNNSFNASFALPDPRRPVGSIFHPSRRSISDRSTSTLTASNDAESEAETVMNEGGADGGDAANELLKVKENRQQLSNQLSSTKSRRFLAMAGGGLQGNSISPTRTDSGNTTDEPGVRCVCHRNDFKGFLVQCESCEMWQHGACVNQHTQPRVYICAFCANTPNMRGGRLRDTGRGGLDFGVASSPLASKSFRSLR